MPEILDLMEYPTHILAQEAYVSSGGYDSNFVTGGTPSADSVYGGGNEATKAVDSDIATYWLSGAGALPHWWKYDLGVGVSKIARKLKMWIRNDAGGSLCKDFTLQGSNNDSDWDVIHTGQYTSNLEDNSNVLQEFTFANLTAYRYYKINITTTWRAGDTVAGLNEIEMMEFALQCFSESIIVEEGTYSLEVIAKQTNSLNETLTRTIGTPIDLSSYDMIKFVIRASRTGSNIKIGFRDSGEEVTEITPNILVVDTFQVVRWGIAGVLKIDKDAVDRLVITIVNADSLNTIYVDDIQAYKVSQAPMLV